MQIDCERSTAAQSDLAREMKGTVGADNTCLPLAVSNLRLFGDAALCRSVQEKEKVFQRAGRTLRPRGHFLSSVSRASLAGDRRPFHSSRAVR